MDPQTEPVERPPTHHRRGPWVFRQRKFLPVPFMALGLVEILWRGHLSPRGTPLRTLCDLAAWMLILSGEGLRIWGVGYIGRKSRSSDIHAARLVTEGPYAYTRNPLYLGGFLMTMGLSLLTGSVWIMAGCAAYWVFVYRPIIHAEEQFLAQAFGPTYDAYRRAVPRWWPRLRPGLRVRGISWRWQELSKEYQTVCAILVTAVLIHVLLLGSKRFSAWRTHRVHATHTTVSPWS